MIKDFLPGGRWPLTTTALDNIRTTQPDMVIIGGSLVNEYVNTIDPATAETNLRRLVTELRTARPGVDILIITYPNIKWPTAKDISVEIINPPANVANRLDLGPDDLVAARRRVRYLDGEPFNINDSYYPYELVQGTEIVNPADVARGTNKALAELGYEQVRAIDEIEARMPHPNEATRLGLGPGNPVAVHSVTGYTADNKPVRHTVNVLIGSKHIVLFERARPEGSES